MTAKPAELARHGFPAGNGKPDFALLWRPSNGDWYVINSSDGTQHVQQWGTAGDIPV